MIGFPFYCFENGLIAFYYETKREIRDLTNVKPTHYCVTVIFWKAWEKIFDPQDVVKSKRHCGDKSI